MTHLRGLAALVAVLVPLTAGAQEWPNRAIRFIVPFPAGGSTDVAARVIGEQLSRALGQQIVVENKSGASGVVGAEAAAKSAPDGYTILIGTDQIATWQHLFNLNFDPMKDLVPVIELSRQPVVLAVHPSLGPATLAEFVALAKQRPGMSYATSGVGSQQHITAQWFAQLAGIKLDHVPYRGGGQAINDLIAGHVKIGSLGSSPLIPHYKAGTIRLLAQSTAARSPGLPEVPTFEEAGFSGFSSRGWIALFVPAKTGPEIAAKLNKEVNEILQRPEVRQRLDAVGFTPNTQSLAAAGDFLRAELDSWSAMVKAIGLAIR
jgi:tripartite-type tricarboxylate transporter receptor subunit TctC